MSIDALVEEYLPYARAIAVGHAAGAFADPDELLSEADRALLRAARAFDTSRGSFKAYAGKAVRNAVRDYLKQSQIDSQLHLSLDFAESWEEDDDQKHREFADEAADTLREVRRNEIAVFTNSLLAECTEDEKTAVRFFAEGRSFWEIAERMHISKTMAHKHCQSSFVKMRTKAEQRGIQGMTLFSQSSSVTKEMQGPQFDLRPLPPKPPEQQKTGGWLKRIFGGK